MGSNIIFKYLFSKKNIMYTTKHAHVGSNKILSDTYIVYNKTNV